MPYSPTTWANGAGGGTPLSAANLNNIEDGIVALDAAVFADPVTALPGSPADKQRALLVDSLTAPTYAWLFQYESGISDANKWVLIGGSPARSEIATSESTSSTSFVDLSTAGPSFTVPRAGVYEVRFGFQANKSVGDVGVIGAVKNGSGATADAEGAGVVAAAPSPNLYSASRSLSLTVAASALLKLQYRTTSANAANILNRWLHVVPVRVA